MAMRLKFDPTKIFHPTQLIVWDNILWSGVNVLACGRRWGKSFFAIHVLFLAAMSKVGVYFWVSPSFKMGRFPFRTLKKLAIKTTNGTCQINETDKRVTLPNGSIIEFHSADDPQSLRSEGLRGVVVDEAAKISEEAWTQAIKPSLTDYEDSWALLLSTPFGRNWFWKIYEDGRDGKNDTRSFNYKSTDNPFVSKKKIALDKLTMSEREYGQEHDAIFYSDSGVVYVREYFNNRREKVDVWKRFISWDTASTVNKNSAYSCGVVGELTYDYRLFIKEVVHKKVEFVQLQYEVENLANKYNQDGLLEGIIIEYESSGIATVQSLKATADPEISQIIIPFNPVQKKEVRALEAAKFMEKGMILFPLYSTDNKWLPVFEDELLAFPDGFKDQSDAFSQLVKVVSPILTQGLLYGKR